MFFCSNIQSLAVYSQMIKIEQFQLALKLNPEYAEAYSTLGTAYGALGLLDKVIEQLQMALKFNPDNADTYSNLGKAYREKGLFELS